ncbi:cytochrome P450 81Q32-like [Tripterygium wilfordii]|uniref:cytochrome P450 81Q32-like n=1 Tax=Tripterygium wilfordii TaxID=458696 RepID=UPI0018F7FB43|nr:cytochrome P450 81Q32-like [Tripterygium wilfordii]
MKDIVLYPALSLLFLALALKLYQSKTSHKNLPPSPPSLPILGHLHLLKRPLYRFYNKLSQKYGPIISLRFGSRLVVVVSSPSAVEECFTKNDIVLANRPRLLVGKHISYNYSTISSAPYGDHWRNLRRIGTLQIFSTHRVNTFASIRKDEIKRLLDKLSRSFGEKVELRSQFSNLTYNIIMREVAGKRYHGDEVESEEEARRFRELLAKMVSISGVSNKGDFLPILNWIDGGKFEKKVKSIAENMDSFLQELVDEQRSKRENSESMNTMIGHLLSLQEEQPQYYTDQIIKGLVMVILFAGSDTTATTLEWAMSNLLNHPEVLRKARAELDDQVGEDRLIEESDLSKLPYLHNIVSETLRLNPAAPLLVPHYSSTDCSIGDYNVPRDTIVLINAWAIQRDPNLWNDPLSFKPERFESGESESYKFLPFGLGRRACPGAITAQRVVGLTLGTLIQCFEWERVSEEEVDITEISANFMHKAISLEAICKARPVMTKLFHEAA